MSDIDNIRLVVDSHHGIYIPQVFCQLAHSDWYIPEDAKNICLQGPEVDGYWEAWDEILNDAYIMLNAARWTLYQDQDLFTVVWDNMTDEEKEDLCG